MSTYYTSLLVRCDPAFSDILMAEIAETGFDTFMEMEDGFEAYAEEANFDAGLLDEIFQKYQHVVPLDVMRGRIQKENWNDQWERNLETIVVDEKCLIRAEFHKVEKKYPYEIVITPKMSFGTGHHQTTWLMIKNQMEIDHRYKRVMDAGCGTAILSIMASKLGASDIEAFDIDEWSVINGEENAVNNGCQNIRIRQGKINELTFEGTFDIILANINKNILLQEIGSYTRYLAKDGMLLMSGFYTGDLEDLIKEGMKYGLAEKVRSERESWAAILLEKP